MWKKKHNLASESNFVVKNSIFQHEFIKSSFNFPLSDHLFWISDILKPSIQNFEKSKIFCHIKFEGFEKKLTIRWIFSQNDYQFSIINVLFQKGEKWICSRIFIENWNWFLKPVLNAITCQIMDINGHFKNWIFKEGHSKTWKKVILLLGMEGLKIENIRLRWNLSEFFPNNIIIFANFLTHT